MTIYWFGGEDFEFPNPNIPSTSTLNTYRRSDYSREAVVPTGSTSKGHYTDPIGSLKSGELWLSFCLYNHTGSGTSYDSYVSLISGETFDGWGIGRSNNYLALGKWTAGVWSWVASSTEDLHLSASVDKFHMYINYAEGGEIKVYRGYTLAYTHSGEVLLSGVDGFNMIQFDGDTNYSPFSEFIFGTENTLYKTVKTLVPNAAGDTNQWHGAYTDIDEAGYSETDFIYSDSSGEVFLSNLTGMPTGAWTIDGVRVCAKVMPVPSGRGIKLGVKTGSSSFSGEIYSGPTPKPVEKIYLLNPNTSSAWVSGEVESLQLLLKTEAV